MPCHREEVFQHAREKLRKWLQLSKRPSDSSELSHGNLLYRSRVYVPQDRACCCHVPSHKSFTSATGDTATSMEVPGVDPDKIFLKGLPCSVYCHDYNVTDIPRRFIRIPVRPRAPGARFDCPLCLLIPPYATLRHPRGRP